ncbi:MAG: hypothetical protein Q8P81_04245 [Nanoarchaeota archaeon]|nr:hypothetical protein [Nanoarchaeota archaeon]
MTTKTKFKQKTVKDVREELEKLVPESLADEYIIGMYHAERGVYLRRKNTSIISTVDNDHGYGQSIGGNEGLYEVHPITPDGWNFQELFGVRNNTAGGLELADVVLIAEATIHFPREALEGVARRYHF